MTKWYVHVNQHKIRKNINASEIDPPIAVKRGKTGPSVYCSDVVLGPGSRLTYSPHAPILSCGARLVIECEEKPEIVS
jgi:hypothetical protein